MGERRWSEHYYRADGTVERVWVYVGEHGAVHISVRDFRKTKELAFEWMKPGNGGVEYHWKYRPEWYSGEPHHEDCWALECPCWHEGSSLQVSEMIDYQQFLDWPNDMVFAELAMRYREQNWFVPGADQ